MKTHLHSRFRHASTSVTLLTGAATVMLTASASAQFYAGRFNSGGTSIFDGENGLRNNGIVASGYYNVANWQDSGGTGGPNDFGADFNIPGDNIGVDENDWGIAASGILHVLTTGTYVFRSGTDDSSRMILDGRNVNVQQGCCGNVDGPGIVLTAGTRHFIQTIVKEGGGGGNAEFSVSLNGGAFSLLGTGASAHPDVNVNQVGFAPVTPPVTIPGLWGQYYPLAGNNQNRDADTFLLTNPAPGGYFISTSINYHGGGNINGHLGADSASLSAGGTDDTDNSFITLSGFLQINAGDDIDAGSAGIQVKFAFDADDNARVSIGGLAVIENDGGHGTGHFVSPNSDLLSAGTGDNAGGTALITFNAPGLYELSAYYHNGVGGFDGQFLSSIGAGSGVGTVPSDRLLRIPEPASVTLAGMVGLLALTRRRRICRQDG